MARSGPRAPAQVWDLLPCMGGGTGSVLHHGPRALGFLGRSELSQKGGLRCCLPRGGMSSVRRQGSGSALGCLLCGCPADCWLQGQAEIWGGSLRALRLCLRPPPMEPALPEVLAGRPPLLLLQNKRFLWEHPFPGIQGRAPWRAVGKRKWVACFGLTFPILTGGPVTSLLTPSALSGIGQRRSKQCSCR